ncbi:hypothetical protein Cgig2_017318 [Carnegiea gigantea]|uniref:Uncharacterized protein n=1 Tax=Carnegiea gigantea TaxID=171969 RepID=A0A9Q1K5Q8_9CARY|nr:hypothetical protein Cgig2_017318 [Carnegiea gigantea]
MTLFFRSMSCRLGPTSAVSPPSPSAWQLGTEDEDEEEQDELHGEESDGSEPISTPFISPKERENGGRGGGGQSPILASVAAVLRKSLLVTCSVERHNLSPSDISCPTDVRHIAHVTFDRFSGFLGLPLELQPDVPTRVPSASASVFGVSPQSLQYAIDERGNSVPTILLMMQKRLYQEGGLQAEGIFRINPENSQEEGVRSQLNKGVLPQEIDVHCLAGLIKAWFRELPKGVLDSLTPEQVMHCNTEDQSTQLVKLLPPTEYALLGWALNLMADVVENEHHNKMNAQNIAMVFAPNMTQMADPLIALIHAVQGSSNLHSSNSLEGHLSNKQQEPTCNKETPYSNKLIRSVTLARFELSPEQKHRKHQKKCNDEGSPYGSIAGGSSPLLSVNPGSRYEGGDVEGIFDRFNFRKGVKKLCRHPVFQLSKPAKKTAELPPL